MPLSSVIGSSSIMQPGVCTSTTRPASPYDGQVIYETDTDKTLVWNGTGWVFLSTSRANPVGFDLIKTQTIGSAVSTVEVADVFSSTYDNYLILVSGGVGSTNINLRLTLGSTATGYSYAGFYAQYSSAGVVATNTNTATFFDVGYATSNAISSRIELESPNLAKRTIVRAQATGSTTTWYRFDYAGFLDNATQYTAFTLTCSTGTITGGTISVYGYAK